ncbi:hypothetical protein ACFWFQ_36615 [Nocardia salmonicida]|uniref:hypothetical protein n=1 Tax=Nocardia salmonicida TaxID=53431 RepID=UPI003662ABE7
MTDIDPVFADAQQFSVQLKRLRMDSGFAIEILDSALRRIDHRDQALLLLSCLGTDVTVGMLDSLLRVGLNSRDALQVRHLIGRLSYAQAVTLVPPAVDRLLEIEADGESFRRMAELLDHLGTRAALDKLCSLAYDSADADVREVASDFSRNVY